MLTLTLTLINHNHNPNPNPNPNPNQAGVKKGTPMSREEMLRSATRLHTNGAKIPRPLTLTLTLTLTLRLASSEYT